jgi:rubrerythrin
VTIDEAIKTGIQFELEVRHVYSEAAKKFKDPVARKIFDALTGLGFWFDYTQFRFDGA